VINYESYCKTDSKGQLFIYNRNLFDDYCRENPSQNFIFKIEKVNNTPDNKLFAYYFAEVVPRCIAGFRKLGENHNKGTVMNELKKYSPVMWKFEMMDGGMLAIDRNFEDLNTFEKIRHIEEIIIFAANELDTKIENPK